VRRRLALTFAAKGERTLSEAYEWLASFDEEAAARFAVRVTERLAELRDDLERGERTPRFDANASIYFARKTYLLTVRTSKGKRRAPMGVWQVFYCFNGANDREPSEISVLGVYHGASRPLAERVTDEGDGGGDEAE